VTVGDDQSDSDGFAVRVLAADVEKRGRRFVRIEFLASTIVAAAFAFAVAIGGRRSTYERCAHADRGRVLRGVAVNSIAVVRWTKREPEGARAQASLADVALFAAATLLPGVLAVSLRRR
jgi:hypothetical protein